VWLARRRDGLLHKSGTKAGRGEVILRLDYGRFIGIAGSRGKGRERVAAALT
jgi:hypothetical protein